MPFLVELALGWKWPGWMAQLFAWAVPALVVAALTSGAIMIIYHRGETAGSAKTEAEAQATHAQAVIEARSDERNAAAVADAIGRRVAVADDKTTALVRSRITEIHDDLATFPGAPAAGDAVPPIFDADRVRASLNVLVDDANRAADAADAGR